MSRSLVIVPRETLAIIVADIASGTRVKDAVHAAGVDWLTYVRMRAHDPNLHSAHMRARLAATHDLLDSIPARVEAERTPARARVIGETLFRYVEKVNPKEYGNQINLTIDERPSINAAMQLAAARIGMQPMRNLDSMVDTETLDGSTYYVPRSTDYESVDAAGAGVDAELLALFSGY